MKTNVCLSLDLDAFLEARKNKINISKLLSDFLVDYTNTKTGVEEFDEVGDKKKHLELQKIKVDKELELLKLLEEKTKQEKIDKYKGEKRWDSKTQKLIFYDDWVKMYGEETW